MACVFLLRHISLLGCIWMSFAEFGGIFCSPRNTMQHCIQMSAAIDRPDFCTLQLGYWYGGWRVDRFTTKEVYGSMILPTYPGKIPQANPNPQKERDSFRICWWNVRGVFQGYVGEILEWLKDHCPHMIYIYIYDRPYLTKLFIPFTNFRIMEISFICPTV